MLSFPTRFCIFSAAFGLSETPTIALWAPAIAQTILRNFAASRGTTGAITIPIIFINWTNQFVFIDTHFMVAMFESVLNKLFALARHSGYCRTKAKANAAKTNVTQHGTTINS